MQFNNQKNYIDNSHYSPTFSSPSHIESKFSNYNIELLEENNLKKIVNQI